ncbi:MAG: DUF6166 domain-containing protein [Steroidobacteraceae bacterium]
MTMQMIDERQGDVRVWREADGALQASVAHLAHHSPSGFECGYGGSGPADLALSILAAFVPARADGPTERLYKGARCSRFAWMHHQRFKWDLIATLPKEGGVLSAADIREWIAAREAEVTEEH